MKQIEVKKGDILQREGELDTKVYHVRKGLLRSYSVDEKGKKHIFMFAPEGWTIADGVTPEQPSELFIDALEDAKVIVLTKDTEREKHNAKPLLKRIMVLQQRVIMLMSSSALQRYEHFLETYPDIIQRVPQKMIASYLGITPEALSKLKRDKARRK
ncbi:MAG: Crp/Fnr family transcriptional regulator [Bacteroidota bacterium]